MRFLRYAPVAGDALRTEYPAIFSNETWSSDDAEKFSYNLVTQNLCNK